jgi:hypothetical protein
VEIKQLPSSTIMTALSVREKYRLDGQEHPYLESIDLLNKTSTYVTPLEKINCLLNAMSAMRMTVIDYWRSKEELDTMDDELPIVIYIVVMSSVPSLAAEVCYLQDYIGDSDRFDNENRILLNIEVSIRYAIENWDAVVSGSCN